CRVEARLCSWGDDQTRFDWSDPNWVQGDKKVLANLAHLLLHSWEQEALLPEGGFPLLIVPCGVLFRLPWAALPLRQGGACLLDAATVGVMPSLGLALWLSSLPSGWISDLPTTVFLPGAPQTAGSLPLSAEFLRWL